MLSDNEPGIISLLSAIAAVSLGGVAPSTLTPSSVVVTTSGTVAANKYFVEFIFSADYTGTINGVAFSGAALGGKSFPNVFPNKYAAISYVVTTGSLTITSF